MCIDRALLDFVGLVLNNSPIASKLVVQDIGALCTVLRVFLCFHISRCVRDFLLTKTPNLAMSIKRGMPHGETTTRQRETTNRIMTVAVTLDVLQRQVRHDRTGNVAIKTYTPYNDQGRAQPLQHVVFAHFIHSKK